MDVVPMRCYNHDYLCDAEQYTRYIHIQNGRKRFLVAYQTRHENDCWLPVKLASQAEHARRVVGRQIDMALARPTTKRENASEVFSSSATMMQSHRVLSRVKRLTTHKLMANATTQSSTSSAHSQIGNQYGGLLKLCYNHILVQC